MKDLTEKCICGHTGLYHAMNRRNRPCDYEKCKCNNFKVMEKKKKPVAFLGGFTYTEAEICKCGHGVWDHKYYERTKKCGECNHVVGKTKDGKKFIKCDCKRFISKVKREVKNGRRKKV